MLTATPAPVDLTLLPPGAEKWTLSDHAVERARERGFSAVELYATAADPEIVVPDLTYESRRSHIRGDCEVVVNVNNHTIITVMESPRATPESTARRLRLAEEWQKPLPPPTGPATPQVVATVVRARKMRGLLERSRVGITRDSITPQMLARKEDPIDEATLAEHTRERLAELHANPYRWATFTTNIPGLPSRLKAEPGVELNTFDGGVMRVRYRPEH